MARGKVKKATKKFQAKHLGNTIENRRIQKKNKDKYNKNKERNALRKAAAKQLAEETGKKVPVKGKKSILEGMSMDEFLQTGGIGEDVMQVEENVEEEQGSEEDDLEKSHKAGLEGLKEKDPAFYQFLKQNDRELLEFDPDELQEEDDEEDEEDAPIEGGLTVETLGRWEKLLKEGKSLGTLKKVLIAVKNAAANFTGEEVQGGNVKYVLTDPEAFDRLLLLAFQQTPEVLQHHVPVIEKAGKIHLPSNNPKLSQIVPLLKSLFQSTLVLLPNLTSPPTTLLVLSQTEKLIPYITGFRKIIKQLVTAILDIWSRTIRTGDEDDKEDKTKIEEQDSVKIAAFLWIRKVVLLGDPALKDLVLKASYASFVKNSRITSSRTLPHLNFLKNSLSELYGFDQRTSYQHAFTYIRQLAINLRNAMTTKSQESTRIVYCWQYLHSLDFFSRMLSQHVGTNTDSELHPLIYPVIQVTLGAIRLNPSSQYFPLRFYLIESLLRLSRQTDVYIPLAPLLLEPLDSSLMKTSPSKKSESVLKPIEFETVLRVSSNYLSGPSSKVYRDQIGEKLCNLLAQYFELHALNLAFPELVFPVLIAIKKWLKRHGGECGGKVRHLLQNLVEKLDEQAKWVEERRRGLPFEPEKLSSGQKVTVENEMTTPLSKWIQKQKAMQE